MFQVSWAGKTVIVVGPARAFVVVGFMFGTVRESGWSGSVRVSGPVRDAKNNSAAFVSRTVRDCPGHSSHSYFCRNCYLMLLSGTARESSAQLTRAVTSQSQISYKSVRAQSQFTQSQLSHSPVAAMSHVMSHSTVTVQSSCRNYSSAGLW